MKLPIRLSSVSRAMTAILMFSIFTGCTPSEESVREKSMEKFILSLETKYKRDAYRNDVDLHFIQTNPGEVKIALTYSSKSTQQEADSIGDAAVSLVRRLHASDPAVKDQSLSVVKEVRPR